ncbi:MAG: hypothetical protein Ct9H300mP1_09450 [Planctomycetaceae bacterium]|nr:MAG: hypothetical protein Ct9H300mP1_09450 [Planctomycetaceae bacterium]
MPGLSTRPGRGGPFDPRSRLTCPFAGVFPWGLLEFRQRDRAVGPEMVWRGASRFVTLSNDATTCNAGVPGEGPGRRTTMTRPNRSWRPGKGALACARSSWLSPGDRLGPWWDSGHRLVAFLAWPREWIAEKNAGLNWGNSIPRSKNFTPLPRLQDGRLRHQGVISQAAVWSALCPKPDRDRPNLALHKPGRCSSPGKAPRGLKPRVAGQPGDAAPKGRAWRPGKT